MELSFVVPLYNCLGLTQAMLASLGAAMPPGLVHEVILVDDGSTDGTREWISGLGPPFRILLQPSNQGYGAANNRGAQAASGRLLALLNNDLVLTPGWLEPMLAAHRRLGARAGLVGNVQRDIRTRRIDHAAIFIDHKGKPAHLRRRPWLGARLVRPVRPAPLMTGACVLVGRELWTRLGGFDPGYVNGCEDIDLCLRAEAAGRINAIAVRSQVWHHISSAPGRKARDEINTYRFTRRWRERLAVLGQPDWCRNYFATYLPDPRDFPAPRLARYLFWYLAGVRRRPPPEAAAGMQEAIEAELARWEEMFGR